VEIIRRDRDRSRDFLADVSHELRTPLAALRTFNELLMEHAGDDPDARVVVLPPGSQSGPPGALPPGSKIFDSAGPGEPEKLEGIPWPAGGPGPILVVQRKEPKPDGKANGERRAPLVGLDVPYSLTVRLGH